MLDRHCFCNLCKGKVQLTKYKVSQHVRIYGLWNVKEAIEGPSIAKKSRANNDSDSSGKSDYETKSKEALPLEQTSVVEDHEDYSVMSQQDGEVNSPTTNEVFVSISSSLSSKLR